jgi:hypothetical protein
MTIPSLVDQRQQVTWDQPPRRALTAPADHVVVSLNKGLSAAMGGVLSGTTERGLAIHVLEPHAFKLATCYAIDDQQVEEAVSILREALAR